VSAGAGGSDNGRLRYTNLCPPRGTGKGQGRVTFNGFHGDFLSNTGFWPELSYNSQLSASIW